MAGKLLPKLCFWLGLLPLALVATSGDLAHAQSVTAPGEPAATRPLAPDSSGPTGIVAYCPDLQRLVTLALTKERFATIAGKQREGDVLDTTLPLTGWKDCSVYGARTYTCDSQSFGSADEVAKAQTVILGEIKTCLGEGWTEDDDRSSPVYAVVRSSRVPVSMTVATNAEADGYVVRLTLFLRTGG